MANIGNVENLGIVINRLEDLTAKVQKAARILKQFEGIRNVLTENEISQSAIDEVQQKAVDKIQPAEIAQAYNACVEAFQATEVIHE